MRFLITLSFLMWNMNEIFLKLFIHPQFFLWIYKKHILAFLRIISRHTLYLLFFLFTYIQTCSQYSNNIKKKINKTIFWHHHKKNGKQVLESDLWIRKRMFVKHQWILLVTQKKQVLNMFSLINIYFWKIVMKWHTIKYQTCVQYKFHKNIFSNIRMLCYFLFVLFIDMWGNI